MRSLRLTPALLMLLAAGCPKTSVSGVVDMAPDLQPSCSDPVGQTECAVDQKCDLVRSTILGCTSAGAVTPGASCRYTEDCIAAATCISGSAVGSSADVRICRRFCHDSTDCPGMARCGGGSLSITGTTLKVCAVACDPFAATQVCGSDTTCRPYTNGTTSETELSTDCGPNGTAAEGEPCSNSILCAAGLLCLDATAGGHCRKLCEIGGAACPGSTACSALQFGSPPKTSTRYGVCCPTGTC